MPALITCMGEALIDFLPLDEGGRTVGFRMYPAGSLLNVAVTCARLGQPVALATKIADDYFGSVLRRYMLEEGVDARFLGRADALSTLAFVAHEGGEPLFTFYGEGAADTLLTAADLPPALFTDTAILHFGSISLLRGSTPATTLAAAEGLRGKALISLDPNLRPGLVHDEAAYRTTLGRAIALADLVKISAADLAWLMPGEAIETAAAALLAQGPALVVITRGGAGVLAARTGSVATLSIPAFTVAVSDTVGAGDSFNGGLLTFLAEAGVTSRAALATLSDEALAAALGFAAAVAAVNCTRPGADPPRRSEVEAFLGS